MNQQSNDSCVCRILLISGETIEIALNKKHTVESLLSYANRQCCLPEASWPYFGLAYVDEKQQIVWLSLDQRVMELSLPKCVVAFSTIKLHQFVRFFPRSYASVNDVVTLLYLFYDARIQFIKGYLVLSLVEFVQCCAALIILSNGQMDLNVNEVADIFNEQIQPSIKLLRTFDATLDQIHEQISDQIKRLRSSSQGQLILLFLKYANQSITFGSAFYAVTDAQRRKMVLAINSRAVVQFDSANLYQPKKVFHFVDIDNIIWKETTLFIHARSNRTLSPRANGMHTLPNKSLQKSIFLCQSAQQCKMIWSAAVAQHKFFVEQEVFGKPTETNVKQRLAKQLEELLISSAQLTSLASTSSIDSSSTVSRYSMPPSSLRLGVLSSSSIVQPECSTAEEKQKMAENYQSLKTKVRLIEDELIEHLNELKAICLEEAQITGQMPKEIYMTLVPGEKLPPIAKRIGTTFRLDPHTIENSNGTDRIEQLRADIELHRKIVEAAERLANDKTTNKSVRRKRRKDLQAAATKLRGLEKGLYQLKMSTSKPDITSNYPYDSGHFSRSRAGSGFSLNSLKNWPNFINGNKTHKSCPTTPRGSFPDLAADEKNPGKGFSRLKTIDQIDNRQPRPREVQSNWLQTVATLSSSGSSLPPAIPSRRPTTSTLNGKDLVTQTDSAKRYPLASSSASEFSTYTNIGYKSSVPYKSAYRQQNYPTLEQYPVQRSKSVTCSSSTQPQHPPQTPVKSVQSTMFSAQKSDLAQRLRVLPISSYSHLSPSSKLGNTFPSTPNSATGLPTKKTNDSMLSDNLSAIVSHMNQAANEIRQSSNTNYRNSRVVLRNNPSTDDYLTASLDRHEMLRQRAETGQTELQQQQRDSVSSGVSSASSSSNTSPTSISRTTTFPVEYNYVIPNQSQTPKRASDSASCLGLNVSCGRIQPINLDSIGLKHVKIDPRMENLLASIHSRAGVQLEGISLATPKKASPAACQSKTKTATIV